MMKPSFSRIFAQLLIAVLILAILPGFALAQETAPVDPEIEKPPVANDEYFPRYPERGLAADSINTPLSEAFSTIDPFGYSLVNQTMNWKDAKGGGDPVAFTNPDSDVKGPFGIPFAFNFYEESYSQFYLSTNGLITFGGSSSTSFNESIPQDTPPNNLIAPFWDDLAIGGEFNDGMVFLLYEGVAPNRYVVIEWDKVTRWDSTDPLTFQVILYENGDIDFQYQLVGGDLGQATVGIEDGDGIYGLLYRYNSSGGAITSGLSMRIQRPAQSDRAKLYPTYASEFAILHKATIQLQLRNTGDLPQNSSDTFNLSATSSAPGWTAEFYSGDGFDALNDTNTDGVVDTGSVSKGESTGLTVKIQAPDTAGPGSYTIFTITARSSRDPSRAVNSTLVSAIPAPFGQAFSDDKYGIRLRLIWENSLVDTQVANWFSGSTMALASTPSRDFVYIWERNYTRVYLDPIRYVNYSNIEFVPLSQFGGLLHPIIAVTDHYNDLQDTTDRRPGLVVNGQSRAGIMFIREIYDTNAGKTNSNVFFAIRSALGEVVAGPIQVTQNTGWRGAEDDINIPLFYSSRVTATADNRFTLAWLDTQLRSNESETSDIWFSVYGPGGGLIKTATALTHSVSSGLQYTSPMVISLASNRILVGYSIYNPADDSYSPAFQVMDSNGNQIVGETIINGASGAGMDGLQLSNGKIIFTWTNYNTDKINYILLNDGSFSVFRAISALANPNSRRPDYVSVTTDVEGHAVLTWMDWFWNDYLYYALINPVGDVVSPPMSYYKGQSVNPLILTSYSGQGIASYGGQWQTFLPMTAR